MAASDEKVKAGGFSFHVFRLTEGGPWYAGVEGSKGSTRSEAIAAHLRYARAARRASDKADRARAAEIAARDKAREGRTCTLSYCSRAIDTPAHRATAKHRNAVAVREYERRYGRFG